MIRYLMFGLLVRRSAAAAAFAAVLASAAVVALSVVRAEDPSEKRADLQLTQATGEPLVPPQLINIAEIPQAQQLLSPAQCVEVDEIQRIRQQLLRPLEGTLFEQVSNTAEAQQTLNDFAETYLRVASQAILAEVPRCTTAGECPCDAAKACEAVKKCACEVAKKCNSCDDAKKCDTACDATKKCVCKVVKKCKPCDVAECVAACEAACQVSKKCECPCDAAKKCAVTCEVSKKCSGCNAKKCGDNCDVAKKCGCRCDAKKSCAANCAADLNCASACSAKKCGLVGKVAKKCKGCCVKATGSDCAAKKCSDAVCPSECVIAVEAFTISLGSQDAELVAALRGSARMLEATAADLEDSQDFARADRLRRLAQQLREEARGSAGVTARTTSSKTPR